MAVHLAGRVRRRRCGRCQRGSGGGRVTPRHRPHPSNSSPKTCRALQPTTSSPATASSAAMGGGLDDGSGHISARDPEHTDSFCSATVSPSRRRRTDDLVLVGPDGSLRHGEGSLTPGRLLIYPHQPIHQARPDIVGVVHTHTGYGTVVLGVVHPPARRDESGSVRLPPRPGRLRRRGPRHRRSRGWRAADDGVGAEPAARARQPRAADRRARPSVRRSRSSPPPSAPPRCRSSAPGTCRQRRGGESKPTPRSARPRVATRHSPGCNGHGSGADALDATRTSATTGETAPDGPRDDRLPHGRRAVPDRHRGRARDPRRHRARSAGAAATTGEADRVRALLCNEPRGHADMYGCFLVPPDDDGADFGVLFWHKDGFSTACGHGTIALGRLGGRRRPGGGRPTTARSTW